MVGSFKVAVKAQHHKQVNTHHPNHLSDKARTLAPKKVGDFFEALTHPQKKKRFLNKTPASIPATIPAETRSTPYFQLQSPLPFTVAKPVPSQEMSTADESRDADLVFGEDLIGSSYDIFDPCPLIADDPRHRPDIA